MLVTVIPNLNASKRTRNRLREHPGVFTLKRTDSPSCLGCKAHLIEHSDGWFGWLPANEITVEEAP